MRRTSLGRFLTSIVIAAFALAGPLAPLAHAQQSDQPAELAQATQPAPPAQPVPPPAPATPPQPTQPDLFQETLKAQRMSDRSQGIYTAEAVVVSAFLIPGRTITCVAGSTVGVALLMLSFGTGYRAASYMFHEGCGGKWIVKGDDLRPDIPSTSMVSDGSR
jgi:hypothetical protein